MTTQGRIKQASGVTVLACAALVTPAQGESVDAQMFEQDRNAILAMAGEYHVGFSFNETVAIEPGYEVKEPYNNEADELILVLEDRGDFISLQHVLVVQEDGDSEPHVIKHWRQDSTYEDTALNEFRGNRTWEHVSLSKAEVRGTWSQAVFEVSDAPRYESLGRWTHEAGRSSWESQETWRPLPRRECTKRHDYGVLVARNRHTLSPTGWVHEQVNHKLVIDDDGKPLKVLAHETGLNVYDRVSDVDFTKVYEYWEVTKSFWQDVRDVWSEFLDKPGRLTLKREVNGEYLNHVIFVLADRVMKADKYEQDAMFPQVRQTIESYIE